MRLHPEEGHQMVVKRSLAKRLQVMAAVATAALLAGALVSPASAHLIIRASDVSAFDGPSQLHADQGDQVDENDQGDQDDEDDQGDQDDENDQGDQADENDQGDQAD